VTLNPQWDTCHTQRGAVRMTTDPNEEELDRHNVPHGGKNGREAE